MPLDEQALRRETFSEGPRVKLGDGQEWTFPRPCLTMCIQFENGKPVPMAGFSYGADYADRLDEYVESEDPTQKILLQLELATTLLLNYDLDNKAIRRLLAIEVGRTDPEMWAAVQDVLFGRDVPKPSAVGSGLPSEPTASTPAASP